MDITGLIPEFGGVVYTLIAFVVALSVIVAVHEFGHYIVGRWSGIHAEVFSLGFGPVLLSRVDRRGTRWQVAALPFGGYVKFMGDSNAASGMDEAAMQDAGRDPVELRKTMHGAPLWARSATVLAGPVFNFIMSIAVFTVVFMVRGVSTEPLTVGELRPMPESGYELQEGDVILSAGGVVPPGFGNSADWETFRTALPSEPLLDYRIERDGSELTVKGPYLYPPLIETVAPRSAAMDIGLEPGDLSPTQRRTMQSLAAAVAQGLEARRDRPLVGSTPHVVLPIHGSEHDVSYVGSARGVAEHIAQDAQQKQQAMRMSHILSGMGAGTWEWNVQTGETRFNERWAEIIGYTLEELTAVLGSRFELIASRSYSKFFSQLVDTAITWGTRRVKARQVSSNSANRVLKNSFCSRFKVEG